MKRFRFRLASILKYRQGLEKQKRISLKQVHELVLGEERKLLEAQSLLDEALDELMTQENGGRIDLAQLRQQMAYTDSLRRRVCGLLGRVRELESRLARRREEVIRARSDRKVIESLKERRHGEYLREAGRDERITLDDIANRKEVLRRQESWERDR